MKNAKVMKMVMAAVAISIFTGCSATNSMFGGSDIQISATEAGMRAYGDHLSSLITNGKASADAPDTPAYGLRRDQTAQETERKWGYRPSFKAKLNGVPSQEGSAS